MNLTDFETPTPARIVNPSFWTNPEQIALVQQWCDDGLLRELDTDTPDVRWGVLVLTDAGREKAGLPPLVVKKKQTQRGLFE